MNKNQEKEQIEKILAENPKIDSSPEDAESQFESHIGFEEEKVEFTDQVKLYLSTKGSFCPTKEVICYAAAPGMGKTTFVQTLTKAMGRGELQIIACAGLENFRDYSILGDENRPSLAAWAIKNSGCKNPVILLDELEKISNEQVQRDLIELFKLYKKEEKEYQNKKLFDRYYQMDIELDHITFFATVNYPQDLVPLLKGGVKMRSLKDYSEKEKIAILKLKKNEIEANIKKIYGEEKEIIPEEIITELPKRIQEAGVRKAEQALRKIEKDYIEAKENNRPFSLGNPKEWLKKNVLAYQESFYPKSKHKWLLFPLWGVIWVLLLIVIVQKIILRKENQKSTENE